MKTLLTCQFYGEIRCAQHTSFSLAYLLFGLCTPPKQIPHIVLPWVCKLDIGKYEHQVEWDRRHKASTATDYVCLGLWCVWSYVCVMHMLLIFYSTTQKKFIWDRRRQTISQSILRERFSISWLLLFHRRRPNFLLWSVASMNIINI